MGAFYGTDLDLQLRRRGIDTIILCGIATAVGVESTARDAYEHNSRQIFVEDAMGALSEESHRNSVERIATCAARSRGGLCSAGERRRRPSQHTAFTAGLGGGVCSSS